MTWFRVDDKFAFHAKVLRAGNEAIGAWTRMGAWSADHGTDGRLPSHVALLIAGRDEVLDRLLEVKLLEKDGSDHDSDVVIHDFLDWNPSVRQVMKERKAKRDAALRGAEKGWQTRRQKNGRTLAEPWHPAIGLPENGDTPTPTPIPTPNRDLEGGMGGSSNGGTPPPTPPPPAPSPKATKGKAKKSPETPLPADWDPSSWAYKWAREKEDVRLDEEHVDRELAKFKDHAETHDRRCVNWDAALRTWLRNARSYAPKLPEPRPPRRPPPPAPPARSEVLASRAPEGASMGALFDAIGRPEDP